MIQEHDKGVRGPENYEKWLADPSIRSHGVCRLASQFAGATNTPIAPILVKYVNATSKSLFFTTPSFGYDIDPSDKEQNRWNNTLASAVKNKASAGVQTTVISNGFGGGGGELNFALEKLMNKKLASEKYLFARILEKISYKFHTQAPIEQFPIYEDLAQTPNISLWFYFQYIHAKTYMFDRTALAIGSYNFDWHSAEANFETMVFCMDDKLRDEFENAFVKDITNSIPFVSSKIVP